MTLRQDPAVAAQFDQVASEYAVPVQAAGMRVTIIDACKRDSTTPAELRRALTRTLQATLPRTVPLSVRTDASRMPDAEFSKTEQRVRAEIIRQAHESPTLRSVIVRDRTGREATEFFGRKRGVGGWLEQYCAVPQLMKRIGDATY